MKRLYMYCIMAICLTIQSAWAGMSDYCQAPPTLATSPSPNVLLMVDTSGSMAWYAYQTITGYSGNDAIYYSNPLDKYDPSVIYEGYFDPTKNYQLNGNDVFVEAPSAGCTAMCVSYKCEDHLLGNCDSVKGTHGCSHQTYACCKEMYTSGCVGDPANGNYLNYLHMARIDLLRWALTGGKLDTCENTIKQCDPEFYPDSNLSGCDDYGCILMTNKRVKVKASWDRITGNQGGLLFQLKKLGMAPRIGSMYFSDSAVNAYVRIGDFTASSAYDGVNPYKNTIFNLNKLAPDGATPTGPAMWAAYNYFSQNASVYGGPDPDNGGGNNYKNPEYQCFDLNSDGNCNGQTEVVKIPCAKNFVILVSDGQWNKGGAPGSVQDTCSINTGFPTWSADPVVPAYLMHKGFTNQRTGDSSRVEDVYAIGLWLGGTGATSLKNIAMYGSFDTTAGTWPGGLSAYPQGSCPMDNCSPSPGKGSACTPLPASSVDWDRDGNNIPDTFFSALNASDIKNNMISILKDIMNKASSGTSVSMLSSQEGSGANLLQALFYPNRPFLHNTEVSWTSDLMNYWYYLDPYMVNMQIREDTVRENADYTLLDMKQDYITTFIYDTTLNKTVAHRWWDTAGTGNTDNATDKGVVPMESSIPLWRAGFNLWWTDPLTRNIYTADNSDSTLIPFTTSNSSQFKDLLGQSNDADTYKIITYIRGYDYADTLGFGCVCNVSGCSNCESGGYSKIGRNRTVTTGVCSTRKSPCSSAADCSPTGQTCDTETHVWKLGDIISSTPQIMGPNPLQAYNYPVPFGYADESYKSFIGSDDYKNRQLAFVGSNDGMLHAFRLGKLIQNWPGKQWYQVAQLEGPTGAGGIGSESYAFIPRNALPYLDFLRDPDYCHLDIVDGPITIADVSLNKPMTCSQAAYSDCPKVTTITGSSVDYSKTSWRTVLIGSMGQGGATCNGAVPNPNRIGTPFSVDGSPVGWSSYFALDVTDQANPKLLWEYSDPALGVTNTGVSIVKEGGQTKRCSNNDSMVCSADGDCGTGQCVKTNGKWFVILASGPTGPIQGMEFKADSDQTLKIFVLDLKTGVPLRTIDTGIPNAFAGSLRLGKIDLQRDTPDQAGNYQDDALYIGYVQNNTSGGVLRLVMNNNADPSTWTWSKVFEGGPVTSSVATLLDRNNGKLYLYFAEGRYFYKDDDLNPAIPFRMYGIQDPCFDPATNKINSECTIVTLGNLKDQSGEPGAMPQEDLGWYYTLDLNGGDTGKGAERVITTPTASSGGAVFFTSFVPTNDVCSFGGTTYYWAFDYVTGSKVTYVLQGKTLIQVSSGEIREVNLSDAFTDEYGRKSLGFNGLASRDPSPSPSNPQPIKRFMHIQEK